ncbi:putative clathrin assembly protein At5g35200 [Euphorbia lathyris]|uniref:putative clathrin assembly protein At5g35200 n=1 Tax=Euphorbia lathyris TaxID=212925 RepID=UPI0033134A40
MSAGDFSQQSMRRAIGALKDSTTVGLVKVNSGKKGLQVAIVKATNHDEALPKEKHMWTIFDSLSASSPRFDVAYCINALHKRISKTRNWTVALKTLVVVHRALREVDCSFHEELTHGSKGRLMLNLSHFRDDSSPHAWDYSAWVRTYSLYLEERLECFSRLKYDVQKNHSRMKGLDTQILLEKLPSMQQLLFRLLDCKPDGIVARNSLIRYALSIVAGESVNLYVAITDGLLDLIDKYFEMERQDALRALEIYKKATSQGEKLSEFFEMCRSLEFGEKQKYMKIEQPPPSFLTAMEEYVEEAPHILALEWVQINDEEGSTPQTVPAPQAILSINRRQIEELEPEPEPETDLVTNLLDLDILSQEGPELNKNNEADPVVTDENVINVENKMNPTYETTSWELALVSAPSSNQTALTSTNFAGGLDLSTLDSLYNSAINTGMNGNQNNVIPNFESGSGGMDIVIPNLDSATSGGMDIVIYNYESGVNGNKKKLNPFESFHDHNKASFSEESNINEEMIVNSIGVELEQQQGNKMEIVPSNPFAIPVMGENLDFHDSSNSGLI